MGQVSEEATKDIVFCGRVYRWSSIDEDDLYNVQSSISSIVSRDTADYPSSREDQAAPDHKVRYAPVIVFADIVSVKRRD